MQIGTRQNLKTLPVFYLFAPGISCHRANMAELEHEMEKLSFDLRVRPSSKFITLEWTLRRLKEQFLDCEVPVKQKTSIKKDRP